MPLVHTDIDAIAASRPVLVDMTEELQSAVTSAGEGHHGVMTETDPSLVDDNFVEMRNAGPRQLAHPPAIMIADDQMLSTGYRSELIADPVARITDILRVCKIAQDPYIVVGCDTVLNGAQQMRLHRREIREGTAANVDDGGMSEMQIGCKPVHVIAPHRYGSGNPVRSSQSRSFERKPGQKA